MQNPFQTPEANLETETPLQGDYGPYEPPRTLVEKALLAFAVVELIVTPFEMITLDSEALIDAQIALGGLQFIAFVTCIVMWCMWIHRATKNAHAAGEILFTPGWAVGWHFVPFANLIKPYQVVDQIRRVSMGSMHGLSDQLIKGWWGAWIASNLFDNISLRLDLHDGPGMTVVGLIAGVLGLASTILARKMVIAVNEGQRAHFSRR